MEHISKARLKALAALKLKKFRRRGGAFLIEGETMLGEALASGWKVGEVVALEEWIAGSPMIQTLRGQGAAVRAVHLSDMRKLSDTFTPQPVVSVVSSPQTGLADLPSPHRLAVLAGVQDPGNAGAIIRSADAFALDAVVFTEGCAEWQNPKVLRSTMGSCFHIPIVSDADPGVLLAWLEERKIAPIAAVAHGGADVTQFTPPPAWALFLGGEAAGLPAAILGKCPHHVTLHTPGRAESLNVAVSAAVIMHILTRPAPE